MPKELVNEPTYYLATKHSYNFIVIGCGGNGSELVPKLCRQLSFKRDSYGNQIHDITLVDKDKVEEKNLLRQNFYKSDLGKNKAEVLAMKCSTVFDMNVKSYDMFVESASDLDKIVSCSGHRIPFIIGCVDTNAVRKLIHQYIKSWRRISPIFWLDAGNEEFAGQVVLAHKIPGGATVRKVDRVVVGSGDNKFEVDTYKFNLPTVCDFYPDMLTSEDKFASEMSCAELAVHNPQAADTNVEAANILYQFIANCLRGNINYHKVTFNVLNGNRETIYNNHSVLESYKLKFDDSDMEEDDGDWETDKVDYVDNALDLAYAGSDDYDDDLR